MMSAFDYSNPVKFYFGAGKFNQLGEIASTHGRKVLLVVSDSTKHTGQLERAQLALSDAGIAFAIYDRFMQNPLSTLVEEGAALARDERCDLVIGIGGGSAMDMAKGIAFCACNEGSIWDYVFGKKQAQHALPVILIPTTAGTGSEANRTAVFTNPQTHDKKGLVNPLIYPVAAIIDPELMLTLPKRVIAGPGADVLFHALESYISRNANPFSEMLSLQAIRLLAKNLPRVYADVNCLEAWEKVTLASTLAGMAIDCAGTTLPHALQHPMGGLLDVVHAEGIAAVYPAFLEYTWSASPEKFAAIAHAMGVNTQGMTTEQAAQSSVSAVTDFLKGINMLPTLSELGVKEEHFDWIINNVLTTMNVVLNNNPRVPDAKTLRDLLTRSL
ncbi:TPA: iron-containing alcohol dehydrogenase [Citrobacter farmeri]|uniref:iron-containing alcohol dehydrogenase n=1 Tax=Citrobacter farmeri TaxID=67824 RepID=UPI00229027F8|nr:iron-containing alcohol dehydrogenase [Citrobacter farmeri]MEC3931524.1 iron-containing alcohol dehydrogenase [Citrobacter farmeri]HCW7014619.1 iron-containing alcohol dehydrogenase [Citrobacter farmeri]HEM6627890.1 iron-containing alcohol dehydrogenase [Citrobacter farmeri]